jgi:hypothetical protein
VVGKVSFNKPDLVDNINAMITHIRRLKPATSKGHFFKKIVLKGTMTPAVYLNVQCLASVVSGPYSVVGTSAAKATDYGPLTTDSSHEQKSQKPDRARAVESSERHRRCRSD